MTTACLQQFDEHVIRVATLKFGIPSHAVTDVVSKITQLPIRDGGLGLRSQRASAPVAFLSSLAQAAPDILRIKAQVGPTPQLDACIVEAYECIVETGYFTRSRREDAVQLPPEPGDFLQHFQEGATHLRHLLLADIEAAQAARLYQEADGVTRARMLSSAGYGAGAWLTAVPTETALTMSDESYQLAWRLRLGIPPYDDLPERCGSKDCLASLRTDAYHYLSCVYVRRTAVTTRHDHLVRLFASMAREAGAFAIVEPSFDGARPDGEICWATWSTRRDLVDVSVIHPTAASYVRAAQTQLGAAKVRETQKKTRYADLAESSHCNLVPLVFETYGALSQCCQDFVAQLNTAFLSAPGAEDLRDQRSVILQRLSVALQSGNARVLAEGRQRSLAAHPPRMLRHPHVRPWQMASNAGASQWQHGAGRALRDGSGDTSARRVWVVPNGVTSTRRVWVEPARDGAARVHGKGDGPRRG